ncbi:MAG: sugar ABC transporter permease [Ruminococcus sp.]|nr:sugar ABC transporter permease [Ruminococcus sp.]
MNLKEKIKRNMDCYLMLAPFMLFFTVFTVLPVAMSLPIGFTDFNMVQTPKFVGLDNYITLFLSDKVFMKSIRTTIIFAFVTAPLSYVMCFLLAWLISGLKRPLRNVLTLIFYIPSMANLYAVWRIIFSGDMNGWLNSFLIDIGFLQSPVQWLTDSRYVLGVAIVVQLWISLGAGFLALSAGFRSIDKSLYETAYIEGMNSKWQELVYIVIPCMKPQMLFAGIMQIVSSFTADSVVRELVGFPSTDYKAHTIMTHAFDYGWVRFEMGYASAICTVLFVVMFVCSRFVNRIFGSER